MDLDLGIGAEHCNEVVEVRGCLLLTQEPDDLVPNLLQRLIDLVLLLVVKVADFLVGRRADLRLDFGRDELLNSHVLPLSFLLEELACDL